MFNEKELEVTFEEACLIDWLITMHSFDLSRYEQLKERQFDALRQKLAIGIVNVDKTNIKLSAEDVEYLFVTCPITFRFEQVDVGFSLKQKLYSLLIPKKLNLTWLTPIVPEDEKNDNNNASTSKNKAEDAEQNCPATSESAVPAGENLS